MANKTIYVKDEALWERAKQLAGKEGLSSVIGEALAEFVQRKEAEAEAQGLSLLEITLQHNDGEETVKFFGKELLAQFPLPSDDHQSGLADLYLTKAGKWLVVLKDAVTYEPFEYRTYDTPEEMAASGVFKSIPDRWEFEEPSEEAVGIKWATWID